MALPSERARPPSAPDVRNVVLMIISHSYRSQEPAAVACWLSVIRNTSARHRGGGSDKCGGILNHRLCVTLITRKRSGSGRFRRRPHASRRCSRQGSTTALSRSQDEARVCFTLRRRLAPAARGTSDEQEVAALQTAQDHVLQHDGVVRIEGNHRIIALLLTKSEHRLEIGVGQDRAIELDVI